LVERDEPRFGVDSHRSHRRREPRTDERVSGSWRGAANLLQRRSEIESNHDVGIEHPKQRVEVAGARRRQEGGHHLALGTHVRVERRGYALDAAPGATRELPDRGRRLADDPCDLLESNAERVVQHEGEPLGGVQRFQHDEQREADRLGAQHFALGVGAFRDGAVAHPRCLPRVLPLDHRIRKSNTGRLFAPGAARSQHVERDSCNHRRQPAAQIVDAGRVCAAQTQPSLLHDVFCLSV
jgi:hypothetical protein